MSVSVRVSNEFFNHAKTVAPRNTRSANQQVEYWGKIGRLAEMYPEWNYSNLAEFLRGVTEDELEKVEQFDLESL